MDSVVSFWGVSSLRENLSFPLVTPGSKGSKQKLQVNLVVQQDNWWHFTSPTRPHTLHPSWCQVWTLASHTGHRKQPNDIIHHPRGKFKWLLLPFGLKVPGYVFWERFDRVLRGIPNIYIIADYVLVNGKAEVPHEKSIITLLETARANNITLNCSPETFFGCHSIIFVFKLKALMFFVGNLTWERCKGDHKRVQATKESSRSLELPGTSQLPKLLQSKVSRANGTTEQEGHSLHLGKLTESSIWVNPERDHSYTFISIFWQFQAKKGLGTVLLQDGTPVIYASRSPPETALFQLGVASKCCICTTDFITMSMATWWPQTLWKKTVTSSSPHLHRPLLWLWQYNVNIEYLKGRWMSLQMHFPDFHPCQLPIKISIIRTSFLSTCSQQKFQLVLQV